MKADLLEIAQNIHRRGLSVPTIFILEMLKPLVSLGLSGAQAASPLLKITFGVSRVEDIIELLSSREKIEILIQALENQCANKERDLWAE